MLVNFTLFFSKFVFLIVICNMSEIDELKKILKTFRVSELQMLLGFAGRNKSGRKSDLLHRAYELLNMKQPTINQKIRELSKTIQLEEELRQKQREYQRRYRERNREALLELRREARSSQRIANMKVHSVNVIDEAPLEPQKTVRRKQNASSKTNGQNSALNTGATTGRQATPATAADMTAPTLRPAVTQQTTIQAVNQPPRATVYPTITSYATQDGRHHNVAQSRMQYNPMYSRYPNSGTPAAALNTFPIHPDVTFKNLPFFEHISDLIKPSSLVPQTTQRMQETSFTFHLTPSQATDIASNRDVRPGAKLDYIYQVQLRFCVLETSSEQDDYFPPGVNVKVNNKVCPLPNPIPTNKPGVEPKRPPKPVNITHMVKLSPTVANHVQIGWAADFGKGYVIRVSLVQKMTASELLNKLRNKGIKHADHTTGLIKEKLNEDADCEIATTSLRVSLLCPLGKFRMSVPCRASTCNHLQCFDAQVYLEMNERRATWTCPVCDKPALFENLTIDGYFQDVLVSPKLTSSVTEIELHKDGSWIAHVAVKKEVLNTSVVAKDDAVEIIGDDIEVIPILSVSAASVITNNISNKTEAAKPEQSKLPVVDLTLSDSDDDDLPLKRKCTTQRNESTKRRMDTASVSSASSRNTVTPGPSSVSSSDHQSPSVIMLSDSPSPPRE